MFERKGIFQVATSVVEEDRLLEVALEAGAADVIAAGENFEVTCTPDVYQAVLAALDDAGIATISAEISRVPSNTIDLDAEQARSVLKLMEALEDNDDVQNVTANFNIPEALMEELANS